MLRTFCKVACALGLSGCVAFPTDYIVRQEGTEPAVYKPGTLFQDSVGGESEVWLKIPTLRVVGCPQDRIEFVARTAHREIRWQVVTPSFGETSARFPAGSFEALSRLPRPLTVLSSAKGPASGACGLKAGTEPPAAGTSAHDEAAYNFALLNIMIAERLPTTAATSWVDQFDYDRDTRSINLLPGMRIRIQPELPFTADSDAAIDPFHPGVLAPPTYLELTAAGHKEPGMGRWSTSLEKLGFMLTKPPVKSTSAETKLKEPRTWTSASGLPDLGSDARFWRLFVPSYLSPAEVSPPTAPCDEICMASRLEGAIAPLRAQLLELAPPADPAATPAADSTAAAPKVADQARPDIKQMLGTGIPQVSETFPHDFEGYPGFTLAGALGKSGLEKLLDTVALNLGTGPNLTQACKATAPNVACFVFRFRAVITPEIPIRVNGQAVWVEAGTTVFDLVQRSSAVQLQGHFSSPLAGPRKGAQRTPVVEAALEQRRLRHWAGTAQDLVVKRRFEGALAPLKTPNESNTLLLDVVLQMGDEISWLH